MPDLDELISTLRSGDDEVAERAAKALGRGGEKAVEALSKLLDEEDSDTRWWAVRALAEVEDVEVGELLLKGLEDREAAVRQCAAVALRKSPSAVASDQLVELLGDEDRMLARLAADALVAIGKPATRALIAVVESGKGKARLEAVRALAMIGDHDSIQALFKLLDEDSALLEYWASEGLDKMGVGMSFFQPE